MYAWIWRHLPGDWRVKSATAAGLALVVVLILWYAVFPWMSEKLRFDHGVVQNGTPGHSGSPNPSSSGSATPERG